MNSAFKKWQVVIDPRRPAYEYDSKGGRVRAHGEEREVAVLFTPSGAIYEVTVTDDETGAAQITSLTIHPAPGEVIDHAALRHLPLRTIAEVAAGHLDRYHDHREDGDSREVAAALASATEEPAERRRSRPDLSTFAARWHATRARAKTGDGQVTGRRDALALHYGVKPATIDLWTRLARDEGLIEDTGRQRRRSASPATKTPASEPARRSAKKK